MSDSPSSLAPRATVAIGVVALVQCTGSSPPASGLTLEAGSDAAFCYPDTDGISGGDYTIDLVVDDAGFFASGDDAGPKNILSTQNDAEVTFTLTNRGTKPHGFKVGCTTTTAPVGCSTTVCFPASSVIDPIAPGASVTISFTTPTPDGVIYPFTSNEPADSDVPALNDGQWSLM